MSAVAEQLRQAREARNLTVQQVVEITKIRTDHLRALTLKAVEQAGQRDS